MRIISTIRLKPVAIMVLLLLLAINCKKELVPALNTTGISDITSESATSGGNIIDEGSTPVIARGVCWNTSVKPTILSSKTIDGDGSGSFISNITLLNNNTVYYLRAYATNSIGTGYGNGLSFTTGNYEVQALITSDVTNISQFSAICGGTITSKPGDPSFLKGICWSKNSNPIIVLDYNNYTYYVYSLGSCNFPCSFTCNVGDEYNPLEPNTTYYVRSFIENNTGTSYGNIVSFKTLPLPIVIPKTKQVYNITQTAAFCGGSILSDFDTTVKAKGVCWSTSQNPTISDNKTIDGFGGAGFVSRLSGLIPNSTYYVSAYATNNRGTGYGEVLPFKTLSDTVPGLITANITNVTQTSAVCGGTITSEGVTAVTGRGVCWSTTQHPTVSDTKTSDGAGPGDFVSALTDLNPNTKYFVRSYATYSEDIVYGSELLFYTLGSVTDIDGNFYNTLIIGTQEWMTENLMVTKYQDGTDIPNVTDQKIWANLKTGAYCNYINDIYYVKTCGRLYNYFALNDSRNLCPAGWIVPTDAEWDILINFLGGPEIAGTKLKDPSWKIPNQADESGFLALPGGKRFIWGELIFDQWVQFSEFRYILEGWWWSSNGNELNIIEQSSRIDRKRAYYEEGASVRCLKDN